MQKMGRCCYFIQEEGIQPLPVRSAASWAGIFDGVDGFPLSEKRVSMAKSSFFQTWRYRLK
jgi:hypothetical protein